MFLKKYKPVSSSFRYKKLIDTYWFKQIKIKKLSYKYINSSGRTNTGCVSIRSRGHKNFKIAMNINYTTIYFKGISLVMGISRQSLNTVFIGLVKFSSGILMYSALIHGVSSGKYLNTIVFHTFKMYRFYKPGCRIFVKLINMKTIFSQLLDETGDHIKYIRAAGTYTKVFQRYRDRCMVSCKFPTGIIKYLPFMTIITLGRNSNIKHKRCFLTKAGNNVKLGFKSKVRGVAMNPVDHPHGGRTKSNSPEKSPWGWVTKKNK